MTGFTIHNDHVVEFMWQRMSSRANFDAAMNDKMIIGSPEPRFTPASQGRFGDSREWFWSSTMRRTIMFRPWSKSTRS